MSTKELNLRKLDYSPTVNPLVEDNEIRVRQKLVRTRSTPSDLLNPETGEVTAATLIHTVETVDEEHFVKVFIDGTKKAFDLTRTASRAFQAILEELNMSEKTFQRGLKELMQKNFLSPKIPNVYWVNPNLFFRGNRVAFMKEYRKKVSNTITDQQNKLPQQDP
jgi:hypothetical protein